MSNYPWEEEEYPSIPPGDDYEEERIRRYDGLPGPCASEPLAYIFKVNNSLLWPGEVEAHVLAEQPGWYIPLFAGIGREPATSAQPLTAQGVGLGAETHALPPSLSPCGYCVMTPRGRVYKFAHTRETAEKKRWALMQKFPMKEQGKIERVYTEKEVKRTLRQLADHVKRLTVARCAEKIAEDFTVKGAEALRSLYIGQVDIDEVMK